MPRLLLILFVFIGVLFPSPGREARAQFIHSYSELDFRGGMDRILVNYLAIYRHILNEEPAPIPRKARKLAITVKQLNLVEIDFKTEPLYKHLKEEMIAESKKLMKATELEETRTIFRKLSVHVANWVSATKPTGMIVVYCPVATAVWVQQQGVLQNPYHGKLLSSYGQVVGGGLSLEKALKDALEEPLENLR